MLLSYRPLQRIGSSTPNGSVKSAMSSSSSNSQHLAMARNQWRRGLCQGLSDEDVFVSGDSHVGDVRAANYAHRKGYGADASNLREQFRPWRLPHQQGPPPKSADHRNWIFNVCQHSRDRERFKILSYNILADYLAQDHKSTLYFHIPHYILSWEWRKRRLFFEFGLWSPDIMCLQEVDKFCDLEGELAVRGYAGIWKMRTGNAVDGCAIFWRTNRFLLRHEEHIEFSKLGLRDNVAQICVLESKIRCLAENATFPASYIQPSGANQVVVCNTHVLYNPKRGEIKLGQVRVLLDRAFAVSRAWNDAPVIVCGDFNSLPMSPLYKFIATQKLNFLGITRDQISGQYSAALHSRFNSQYSSYRPMNFGPNASETTFGATAIKLGKVENFRYSNGENIPGRTHESYIEESVIYADNDAVKNREENQKNSSEDPCTEGYKLHSIGSNFTGSDPSFHSNRDDLSTIDSNDGFVEGDDVPLISNKNGDISCKEIVSEKVLEETIALCGNLNTEFTSNEIKQSSELSGLQENTDPTFFKDLLGLEDGHQTMRGFNSSNFYLQRDSPAAFNGAVVNEDRRFYNPYCWSPMEAEIASGKAKCTVVEHSLKLRSVYTDVEDYTGTKDSSREPQVTTYNQQFMGTVDYIWVVLLNIDVTLGGAISAGSCFS